ncbi:hypothetical protein BJ138DRAFT_1067846 [Hygrophoropsis aurantiaca]|uniref:Uncharacterized protein n=1 Tax=Hygrophoropsis aurantiaca TaxID=72124 RepID=A0ACB8A7F4_9AGAM|nr:hypothetical protein BJ138DRAFT_1067846 [Hygrophoropsis aurantiaca]
MDYLRNFGSAAVSTLIQKSGINLPFSLGPKIASNETVWNLYDATKRDDGSAVSVFEYELTHPLNKPTIPLARNALRKLRTIRHPDTLKFMDVVESDSVIYIMTERVRPLSAALQTWSTQAQEREDWLLWGLHRISVALAFINDTCASSHGNVRTNAIFISPSGEWKLGGFELLSNPKDDLAVLYTMGGLLPDAMLCAPPEVKKGGWSSLKEHPVSASDAYALGLLLHAVFNPTHPPPPTAQPPHPPPLPSSRGAIPTSVFPSFKKLLNPNPKARMTPKTFLENGMAESGDGFFVKNRLVKVCAGLDNFSLAGEAEKSSFLRTLKDSMSSFPPEFSSHRVLPSLLSALDHAGASAASILPLILALGASVSPQEYSSAVLAPLVKLYASPDRGTRMALLDALPEYAEKLDKRMVTEQVWPHLQTGFSDTVAVIREATVRAIVLLAPKLSDRILNNDLLRHLARMQSDPEASIRTNTCILIGRLGPSLGYNTKKKVLIPAFGKATKDPFVHARVAGVMAFMACAECFEVEDVAARVVPCAAGAMLDKEKLVRDQAAKAVELFVKRLEAYAAAMPETALTSSGDDAASETTMPMPPGGLNQAALVNTAAGAAGALAGWAISSLGKKLVPADMQSTMSTTAGSRTSTPLPAPAPSFDILSPSPSPSANASSSSQPKARGGGMQLGATKSKLPIGVLVAEQEARSMSGTWPGDGDGDDLLGEEDWSTCLPFVILLLFCEFATASTSGTGLGISLNGSGSAAAQQDDDEWGEMDTSASQSKADNLGFVDPWAAPVPPPIIRAQPLSPKRAMSPQPRPQSIARALSPAPNSQVQRTASSPAHVSVVAPQPRTLVPGSFSVSASANSSGRTTPVPAEPEAKSMSGMSKEEKAAEMARRKEERRLRIEKLKEAKKNAVGSKS